MRSRVTAAAAAATLLMAAPVGAGASGPFVDDATILYQLDGPPGSLFGWAVSELTDIDHDGVTDLIVAAPLLGGDGSGGAIVYSGATGEPLWALSEGVPGELNGYAIADAGDVNADGTHDIAVGARNGSRLYVYSGATGERLLMVDGETPTDFFGFAVAGAGDVDGDGHDDVLVGAPQNDAVGLDGGRGYVISGADGTTIRTYDAASAGDLFGSATDSVADLDHDGVRDHVIGARDAGKFRDGSVVAFSGATGAGLWTTEGTKKNEDLGYFFVAGLGDVDLDGTPDVFAADFDYTDAGNQRGAAYVLSGVDGSIIRSWFGSGAKEGFGPGREAGDVDGDGVPDVAVGSWISSDAAKEAGKVEIFSGADSHRLRVITGAIPLVQLGFDAQTIGDVDGDGIPDLVVSGANRDVVYMVAGER